MQRRDDHQNDRLIFETPDAKATTNTDGRMCILQCISALVSTEGFAFPTKSFNRDRHRRTVRHILDDAFSPDPLMQLRTSCFALLKNISEQYATSLASPCDEQDESSSGSEEPSGSNDESDSVPSDTSGSSTEMESADGSDSNWTGEIDDIELDEMDDVNGNAVSNSEHECAVDKTPSHFDSNRKHRNKVTVANIGDEQTEASDDDDSFDPAPAQRQLDRHLERQGQKPLDRHEDNLLCPGDVVEYQCVNYGGPVKRATITSIKDSRRTQYVQLDNDYVLRPRLHRVRKVKMYCGATGNLIPNPMATWHGVEQCTLQAGALRPDHRVPEDDDGSAADSCASDESSIDLGYVTHVGQKRQRASTSEGLTKNKRKLRMQQVRRWNEYMNAKMPYPQFAWAEKGSDDYFHAIDTVNDRYRKMLAIGKATKVFRDAQNGLCTMLSAKTKPQFQQAARNVNLSYTRYTKDPLTNFRVHTELLPDPRKYQFEHLRGHASRQTNRQIHVKEQILRFEHYLANLNVLECKECKECSIEEKPAANESDYRCSSCRKRKDPNFFLDNNLHPVWYPVDSKGNYVKDRHGRKIPQYGIPEELSRLSMGEKLLIRRCANMVPSVHIRSGIFGLKGHCVTFPQDISDMCDELPMRSESVVTFIRNMGNKDTTGGYPTMLKVKRENVIEALLWLKKHNPFYRNIRINESNLDWMEGNEEANLATVAEEIDVKETARSKLAENEQEYVSRCHAQNPDSDEDDVLPVAGMHANEKPSVPRGEQAAPIRELIDVAKETQQMSKAMEFPPIDHESPIS